MDALGEAKWQIVTVWSIRLNVALSVFILAYRSIPYVCVRFVCLVWLLCVLRVKHLWGTDLSPREV
jgi:hypothetical protein